MDTAACGRERPSFEEERRKKEIVIDLEPKRADQCGSVAVPWYDEPSRIIWSEVDEVQITCSRVLLLHRFLLASLFAAHIQQQHHSHVAVIPR